MDDRELSLTVSPDKLPPGASFSLDIGCSCCKLVYVKQRDESDQDENQNASLQLRFAKCSLEKVTDMVSTIRQEIPPDSVSTNLSCTGLYSCGPVIKELEGEFQTKACILSEFECMGKGFDFLVRQVPEADAFHPPSSGGLQSAMGMNDQFKEVQQKLHGHREPSSEDRTNDTPKDLGNEPLSERLGDIYPCIIATGGTAFCINLVESVNSLKMIDMSTRCGGSLSGLGQLLLGEKDYSKITDLAAHGDESKVTTYFKELRRRAVDAEGCSESYEAIPDSLMCFSFMKSCQDNPEYTRADLARALVYMLAEDMAQLSYFIGRLHDCKHVFVTGGVTNHEVVREAFTRHFYHRVLANNTDCDLFFVKHGQYAGAIGALLSSNECESNPNKQ